MQIQALNNVNGEPLTFGLNNRKAGFFSIYFEAADEYPTGGIDLTGLFKALFDIQWVEQMVFTSSGAFFVQSATPLFQGEVQPRWDAANQKLLLYRMLVDNPEAEADTEIGDGAHTRNRIEGMIVGA